MFNLHADLEEFLGAFQAKLAKYLLDLKVFKQKEE
jgi:hypothetical protein